jgi:hypothetical protein
MRGSPCAWLSNAFGPAPLTPVVSGKLPMSIHPPRRIAALGFLCLGVVMFCGGVVLLLDLLAGRSIPVLQPDHAGERFCGITAWVSVVGTVLGGAAMASFATYGLFRGTRP